MKLYAHKWKKQKKHDLNRTQKRGKNKKKQTTEFTHGASVTRCYLAFKHIWKRKMNINRSHNTVYSHNAQYLISIKSSVSDLSHTPTTHFLITNGFLGDFLRDPWSQSILKPWLTNQSQGVTFTPSKEKMQ